MKHIKIDCNWITDWESFHDIFAEKFWFFDWYWRNMDAWNDCMSSINDPDDPRDWLVGIHVKAWDTVVLQLENVKNFKERCFDQYEALIECSAFINWRMIDRWDPPVLVLSFYW